MAIVLLEKTGSHLPSRHRRIVNQTISGTNFSLWQSGSRFSPLYWVSHGFSANDAMNSPQGPAHVATMSPGLPANASSWGIARPRGRSPRDPLVPRHLPRLDRSPWWWSLSSWSPPRRSHGFGGGGYWREMSLSSAGHVYDHVFSKKDC